MDNPTAVILFRRLQSDTDRIASLEVALTRAAGYLEASVKEALEEANRVDAELRFCGMDEALKSSLARLRSQCRHTATNVRKSYEKLSSVPDAVQSQVSYQDEQTHRGRAAI